MDLYTPLLKKCLPELFQSASEGIIISDSEGTIVLANPGAHHMFGYEKSKMIDLVIEDLIPKRFILQHKAYRQQYHKSLRKRAMGKNIDLFAKRKNGEEFPAEVSLSHFIKDSKFYVLAIVVDITERKHQDELILKLNRELEQKVLERTEALQKSLGELEDSKKQLEAALSNEKELNDLKSRFVTTASHEFRTPLSTILLSMSLIEKYRELNDVEKHQKHVKRVKSAVTGLMLILEDLLCTEELQKGIMKLNKIDFSLKTLVSNLTKKMQPILLPGQEITFTYKGKEQVSSDKQIITIILTHLISNASKFSGENKLIAIHIRTSPKAVIIQVIDEGIGIPPKDQKHIGKKFFRAGNAINIQGTGLGLTIIQQYIDLMHGELKFESTPGKGTIITIKLPNNASL